MERQKKQEYCIYFKKKGPKIKKLFKFYPIPLLLWEFATDFNGNMEISLLFLVVYSDIYREWSTANKNFTFSTTFFFSVLLLCIVNLNSGLFACTVLLTFAHSHRNLLFFKKVFYPDRNYFDVWKCNSSLHTEIAIPFSWCGGGMSGSTVQCTERLQLFGDKVSFTTVLFTSRSEFLMLLV